MSLPKSDESTELLLSMLNDGEASVLTAALQALESLDVGTRDQRLMKLGAHPMESIRARANRIASR